MAAAFAAAYEPQFLVRAAGRSWLLFDARAHEAVMYGLVDVAWCVWRR
jgi:hypothetical protein